MSHDQAHSPTEFTMCTHYFRILHKPGQQLLVASSYDAALQARGKGVQIVAKVSRYIDKYVGKVYLNSHSKGIERI